jgi:hypothetical protein
MAEANSLRTMDEIDVPLSTQELKLFPPLVAEIMLEIFPHG